MTIQIDKYTKGVLTIIAIALMIIALKGTGLISTANALDSMDYTMIQQGIQDIVSAIYSCNR